MRFVFRAQNAIVFYDFDYEEFVVKFYRGPEVIEDGDYFTDDQDDAIATACSFQLEPA